MKQQRILLLTLVAFVVLTVIPSALFMLVRPAAGLYNLSLSVLSYSIFKKYFMLSFFLSIGVGGISFITFLRVLKHKVNAGLWCYLTSIAIIVWIVTQVILIGQLNWLHLVYFVAGLLVLLLANMHRHYRHHL